MAYERQIRIYLSFYLYKSEAFFVYFPTSESSTNQNKFWGVTFFSKESKYILMDFGRFFKVFFAENKRLLSQ